MTRCSQIAGEGRDASDLSVWRSADTLDLAYVGYGLLIVALVLVSYVLGVFNWLPHDPEQIRFDLLNAPPGSAGHLLGTDFLGRDILSRLIVAIQAYFLPGLVAIVISLVVGTTPGALAGDRAAEGGVPGPYFNKLVGCFPSLVLLLLRVAASTAATNYII